MVTEMGDKFEILVTATPKDYVDALIATLRAAHLRPVALELESQSTARALVAPDDAKQVVLILDMSASVTNLIIVNNGILEYTSSIPLAGNTLTEAIAGALSVPAPEAEKLKKELGLLTETKRGNIRQAILPVLDNIVDEIKNVVKFHDEHSSDHKPIAKVLLCGGSAKLLGVADYISARLNLGAGKPLGRIALADPLVNLKLGNIKEPQLLSKEQALSLSTVIGLALRGIKVT
jgi:type IV pilus assembly protein PilM